MSRIFGGLLFATTSAFATTIDVLWYTYADPASEYVSFYSSLAGSQPGSAGTYPESSGLTWNLTFFSPSSPAPSFASYDVLVVHSGEAFRTGAPGGPLAVPDYSGILNNRLGIEAARGNRTFISGADADFHAVRGDSGLCAAFSGCGLWDGARGYVINAVNWTGSGAGLGILSFFHGEFSGSYWWDDPRSFLRSELEGNWDRLRENAMAIPAAATGYPLNQGLTSTGLSNWFYSFHGGFSEIPGYSSTVESGSQPGYAMSIATIDLCSPAAGRYCLAAALSEPSSASLLLGSFMLFLTFNATSGRKRRLRDSM